MDQVKIAKSCLVKFQYLQHEIAQIDNEVEQLLKNDANRSLIVELHLTLKELSDQCLRISQSIEKLPPLESLVLRYRYILCYSWGDICEEIGYEWAQTYRIHRRALEMFHQIHKY